MAVNLFRTTLIPKNQIVYIYDLVKNIIAPGNRAFVSPEIQKVIDEVLDNKFPEGWRDNTDFIQNIIKRFKQKNFSTYSEEYFPEYYAAYYLPNNLYKIQLMFLELFRLGHISFSEKKLRILDIGSAVGTTAWALWDFYDILVNVLRLYGLKDEKLPEMEVDSLEKFQSNIDFFNVIRKQFLKSSSKVIVNTPIKGDVIEGALDEVKIKNYDVIIASNIINEFPSYKHQKLFVENIVQRQKKSSAFVLIETASLKDTRPLKRIQYELAKRDNLQIVSPCGKINGYSDRCLDCWSFRRENLIIPETMKLFSTHINDVDENEKLKWSYSIFAKSNINNRYKKNEYPLLSDITLEGEPQKISVEVEIVSGIMFKDDDKKHYYLKVCDQSEDSERFILKIPRYFELPRYHFGDVFEIKNANVEEIEWGKPETISFALAIDPLETTVHNISELSEPRGLIKFHNIQENNLLYFLKRFFGFEEFNEGQFEILTKILENENVLGILATGGGKSLTYQLPALLKPGISIIVCPLKSLMDDQVHGMKNRFGFDFVDRIHSGMPLQEKQHVLDRFKNGHLKILYVAPERLQQKTFQKELTNLINKGININYFPIDEAHCISEWGHDFRPAYSRLKERQQELLHIDGSHPPIVALTATASQKVQEDILNQLLMNSENDLVHKIIDRKELSLEVIPLQYNTATGEYNIRYRDSENRDSFKEKSFQPGTMRHEILEYILHEILPTRFDQFDLSKDAGLIFTIYADPKPAKDQNEFLSDKCRESEGAKWLSKYLNNQGIECRPWYATPGYRAGRKQEEKKKIKKEWEKKKVQTQDDYIQNRVNLLVTTKGFGMGIDKPNIRYIIHFGFPGSLEAYFQQIGRAGRDRNHSHCILLWDGPTSDCEESLIESHIPNCFSFNESINKTEYIGCPFNRVRKCDYAKQIFFIESGYPTVEELQAALDYIKETAEEKQWFPWVYLKKDYLKDHIAYTLNYDGRHHTQINEVLILETLYTLKYVSEFSQTYLNILIKRDVTMREIYNSTNSEIVKEHIQLLDRIFPDFMDAPPSQEFRNFCISEYVRQIRAQKNQEVLIDEVVEFFNILNDRADVELRFNYDKDFGYEIKLNQEFMTTDIDKAEEFQMVTDWKTSQYNMLENMVTYANLQPFDQKGITDHQRCRRSHIMAVFGTEGAQLNDSVRCNYCDNCGYMNPWDEKASDIVADSIQQDFISSLRKYYSETSKDPRYVESNNNRLFEMTKYMIDNDLLDVVETISNSWLEQIGEGNNAATNFLLATVHYIQEDFTRYNNRLKTFFEEVRDNTNVLQETIIFLTDTLNVDPVSIYNEHFKLSGKQGLQRALNIFSSDQSDKMKEIETEIGLNIVESQFNRYDKIIKNYERMTF